MRRSATRAATAAISRSWLIRSKNFARSWLTLPQFVEIMSSPRYRRKLKPIKNQTGISQISLAYSAMARSAENQLIPAMLSKAALHQR